jgi:hypothetical protein
MSDPERLNLTNRINKQMRIRGKKPNFVNSANQSTSMVKKREISTYPSIITLNISGLNSPNKSSDCPN